MTPTLFFHDYETWGINPQKDFPNQFAGIRTDLDLNVIGKPVNFFCQIPNDYLPHPQACLVTGITPQQSLRDGLIEAEFVKKIHAEFSQPNTCVLGYNSIRFDDEVTRNTFYRNFYDPYAREWQNGNSRWDIIDMARACYALRPEGINWPKSEQGLPVFKLEALSAANQIEHTDAHDAMSDVYATIGIAKLIKQAQPKLYDYLFNLRHKAQVSAQLDCFNQTPVVHISSKLPSQHGCCTWIMPICPHPTNKNAVITLNLALDPSPLFDLSVDELRTKLYQRSEDLADNEQRLPIKLIHINKCPVVAPAKTLTEQNAERLGIDRALCLQHHHQLKQFDGLQDKLSLVFEQPANHTEIDPDHALYSGGFFSDADKAKMDRIRHTAPELLGTTDWQFDDSRLQTMLFRYRARNFPNSLNDEELQRWQRHRHYRLTEPDSPASLKMPEYAQQLDLLMHENTNNPNNLAVLKALYDYMLQL